eukprot:scaffold1311_cov256-Pinguiococcus_pyrenoidosus.AAC.21
MQRKAAPVQGSCVRSDNSNDALGSARLSKFRALAASWHARLCTCSFRSSSSWPKSSPAPIDTHGPSDQGPSLKAGVVDDGYGRQQNVALSRSKR